MLRKKARKIINIFENIIELKKKDFSLLTYTLISLFSKTPEITNFFLNFWKLNFKIYLFPYHKKSVQNAQNVGCRKNLATNLCPFTSCTLWCLIAPRRFVMPGPRNRCSLLPEEQLAPSPSVGDTNGMVSVEPSWHGATWSAKKHSQMTVACYEQRLTSLIFRLRKKKRHRWLTPLDVTSHCVIKIGYKYSLTYYR